MLLLIAGGCHETADPALREPLEILGRTGYGPREFSYPRAIAMTDDDVAYIVDKTGRVQAFTADLELLTFWKTPAIEAGKPTGLGILANGTIAVADTHYARVLEYSPAGELIAAHGTFGEGPGEFHLPTDVAALPDGSIFVGEYGGNDRVTQFARDWGFVRHFGDGRNTDLQFARPQSLLAGPDGNLWICDARHHRICEYSKDGEFVRSFGEMGTTVGKLRFPYGIDFLSDGTLVIAEYGNNRVQRFTRKGESLGTWGRAGRDPGELAYPWAVAVDSQDRVWVVDSGNNRVQIIDGRDNRNWRK